MKGFKNHKAVPALTLLIGFLFLLSGCGGGGGTTSSGTSSTISGTAVKGPVSGGTVKAYAIDNGAKGSELATAMTDTQGNFTMSIQNYSGPVMLLMSGGTYTDEATGTVMTMGTSDVMTAVMSEMASGATITGVRITPLTSMAQMMAANMTSGMTTTNIAAANTSVGHYFMVNDILHAMPMNPLVSKSGSGATQDMKNYGIAIAAMTQYAKSLGMTDSSGIVTAMMDDASDGIMNGMMGSNSITMGGGMSMMGGGTMMQSSAGTSGLADAVTAFMNSAMNSSGLAASDVQPLVDHLNASGGVLQ